jgi:hypothetical protein
MLSRNRNFALFQEPGNREALSLNRYLDALAEEIAEGDARSSLGVALCAPPVGPHRLELSRRDLSVTHTVHLHPEELQALGLRGDVRAILRRYDVELPMAGS